LSAAELYSPISIKRAGRTEAEIERIAAAVVEILKRHHPITDLADGRRVGWRSELRGGKLTKLPFASLNREAQADDLDALLAPAAQQASPAPEPADCRSRRASPP
jgi:hypothetical protein